MSSRYKFSEEEIAAIEEARKANKDNRAEARLKAPELRAKGSKLKEVAEKTGFHEAYVTALVAKSRNKGLEWIAGSNYCGNRRNMGVEEGAEILAPFKTRAEKGEIIEVSEIEEAYQAKVDHQKCSVPSYTGIQVCLRRNRTLDGRLLLSCHALLQHGVYESVSQGTV